MHGDFYVEEEAKRLEWLLMQLADDRIDAESPSNSLYTLSVSIPTPGSFFALLTR